jgi:DNA-binding MarR family transcriptional regulator
VFVLTDLGRQTIETAAPSHVAQVRRLLLDQLSSEQVEQLGDITDLGLRMLQAGGCTEGPSGAEPDRDHRR